MYTCKYGAGAVDCVQVTLEDRRHAAAAIPLSFPRESLEILAVGTFKRSKESEPNTPASEATSTNLSFPLPFPSPLHTVYYGS